MNNLENPALYKKSGLNRGIYYFPYLDSKT